MKLIRPLVIGFLAVSPAFVHGECAAPRRDNGQRRTDTRGIGGLVRGHEGRLMLQGPYALGGRMNGYWDAER